MTVKKMFPLQITLYRKYESEINTFKVFQTYIHMYIFAMCVYAPIRKLCIGIKYLFEHIFYLYMASITCKKTEIFQKLPVNEFL